MYESEIIPHYPRSSYTARFRILHIPATTPTHLPATQIPRHPAGLTRTKKKQNPKKERLTFAKNYPAPCPLT
jgi:hypothetical protein